MKPMTNAPGWCQGDFEQLAWEIGSTIAATHADEVDRNARFPAETVRALTEAGLMSAMVPSDLEGQGASMRSIATATRALAHHCSASALVFAMHQMQVACLNDHGSTEPLRELLRSVATRGTLIGNANSEVGIGGVTGESLCAVLQDGGRVMLEKNVLAISYGLVADALLITARRHPDAVASDQVLLALRPGSFTLEQTSGWDTIGLRGTCSAGFRVQADESEDMLFPDGWITIVEQTGAPATEILLNSVWLGIAESAAQRAHRFVRASARRNIGTPPLNAPLLAEVAVTLGSARSAMTSFLDHFESATGTEEIHSVATILALRNLKLSTTTLAIEIVTKASMICGFAGYHRDSEYSMDRNLRDIFGGPLMANNTRFMSQNAHMLLAMREM